MTLTTILEYALQGAESKLEFYDKCMTDAELLGSETMTTYYESLCETCKNDINELTKLSLDNIIKRTSCVYNKETDFTILKGK